MSAPQKIVRIRLICLKRKIRHFCAVSDTLVRYSVRISNHQIPPKIQIRTIRLKYQNVTKREQIVLKSVRMSNARILLYSI